MRVRMKPAGPSARCSADVARTLWHEGKPRHLHVCGVLPDHLDVQAQVRHIMVCGL